MNINSHSHKAIINEPDVEFPQPGGRSPKYHQNFPTKFLFLFGDLAPNFAFILEVRSKPPSPNMEVPPWAFPLI